MSILRSRRCVVLVAALAASCWDGALDPILGAPDGGDADTDSDADTDTGSDSETEPAACFVAVSIELYSYFPPYYDLCDFQFDGLCAQDAADCTGCAWISGVEGDCAGDEVCCIGETDLEHCVTEWDFDFYCGYQAGGCEVEPEYGEGVEEPICSDGTFCCFTP